MKISKWVRGQYRDDEVADEASAADFMEKAERQISKPKRRDTGDFVDGLRSKIARQSWWLWLQHGMYLKAIRALRDASAERDRYAARVKKLEAERDEMRRILR